MIEAAHLVMLYGVPVGTLVQRGDASRFVFMDGYWETPDRPVLGLWFEDNPGSTPSASLNLPVWFSNLLPEGPLRYFVARDAGVSRDRELLLLLHIGNDLPGAVEIVRDAGIMPGVDDYAAITAPSSLDGGAASWKFSLAGVGVKFSVAERHDRLTMPAKDELGDWIVKLPSTEAARVPANEFSSMCLAKDIGIDVPEFRLVHRDKLPSFPDSLWPNGEDLAYAVRRFDRGPNGERIHIEDFAQVRNYYPDDRYTGSFETVAALAYRGEDRASLREAVRRLAFNICIGNGDAHLKNWSFIYRNKRTPSLSPAYDLVCTGVYGESSTPEDLGLKLNGSKLFSRVSRTAFERLQFKLGARNDDVLDVLDDVIETFPIAFEKNREYMPVEVGKWVEGHFAAMRAVLSRQR